MNYANVVVLSNDYRYKIAIMEKLKLEPSFKLDITALNITSAQMKFVRSMPNVLVLDTDTQDAELRFLKMLMEKYMLFVIAAGRRLTINDPGIPFVQKPAASSIESNGAAAAVAVQKIKSLISSAPLITARDYGSFVDSRSMIIAVASSTGGTEALPVILRELPADIPPILIVQHMPSGFTKQLAERIDKLSAVTVKEAQNGEFIKRGTAYIAPGDLHMRMVVRQQKLTLECFFADKMHGVRPAADILFDTVARISGANAVGVVLTGMGADGARGLVEMRKKGAKVIGQNKSTCVVYGMPKAAMDLGAVDVELPLQSIARKITEYAKC